MTGTVRKDISVESVLHLMKYVTPSGSVKVLSHCGLPSGMAEVLAEVT